MASTPKILVVSNLQTTSPLWAFNAIQMPMRVILETDPESTVRHWNEKNPDMIIFDVESQELSIMETIRELREETVIPILLLTSNRNESLMLTAYNAGVDEYILKPIIPPLFQAKIKAWLRRSLTVPVNILDALKVGNVNLIPSNRTIVIDDRDPIHLTNLEVRLLYYLMGRPGVTVTTDELCERVWGYGDEGNATKLKNVIYRLRRKIEPDPANPYYILTIAGLGYQFRAK